MARKRGPRYSKEEFERRGDAIYEAEVRPNMKKKDYDKFVAIDIESGEFEIASKELLACARLRKRLRDPQIWLMRIGSKFLYTFGGYGSRTSHDSRPDYAVQSQSSRGITRQQRPAR